VVALGDTPAAIPARRHIRLNAEPWAEMIALWNSPRRWDASWWPFGGLAAAALAAGEAFKVTMLKLLPHAINPEMMAAVFAPTDAATFRLAPPNTPYARDLGVVDFISGGAINSGALYALARLPAVRLRGRMIEPDHYSLMLARHVGLDKAPTLISLLGGRISLEPIVIRYALGSSIESLAPRSSSASTTSRRVGTCNGRTLIGWRSAPTPICPRWRPSTSPAWGVLSVCTRKTTPATRRSQPRPVSPSGAGFW
jgi:hypothetical protein